MKYLISKTIIDLQVFAPTPCTLNHLVSLAISRVFLPSSSILPSFFSLSLLPSFFYQP